MAKQSGLGDQLLVADSGGTQRDISNDVTSLSIKTPQGLQDITGLDKSAMERLGLLQDASFEVSGVFNPTANMSHDVFKSKANARLVTYRVGGNTATNPELEMNMRVENYNLSRASNGSLTWSATLQLSDGTVPTWGTV